MTLAAEVAPFSDALVGPVGKPYSSGMSALPSPGESTAPSIADAFRATLDLFGTGLDLMGQNLRRRHPEAGDDEIEQLLRQWLLDRPGAAAGDCAGQAVESRAGRA